MAQRLLRCRLPKPILQFTDHLSKHGHKGVTDGQRWQLYKYAHHFRLQMPEYEREVVLWLGQHKRPEPERSVLESVKPKHPDNQLKLFEKV